MNNKYYIPLHIAAGKNLEEIGELLISKGADINAKTNDIIYTISHMDPIEKIKGRR